MPSSFPDSEQNFLKIPGFLKLTCQWVEITRKQIKPKQGNKMPRNIHS